MSEEMMDDERWLVDSPSAVTTDDGFRLGVAVDETGAWWPFIQDLRDGGVQLLPRRPENWGPAHEQLGALPDAFRVLACGARTRTGKPCQMSVARLGDRCHHHRGRPIVQPSSEATPPDIAGQYLIPGIDAS